MKKYRTYFSSFICLLQLLSCTSGCKKEPAPEFLDFIFEVPLQITPVQDTVNIGDTLWLEADFPDTVKEHNSGKYYQLLPTDFNFRTRIGFFRLVSVKGDISDQPGFTQGFDIVNQVGSVERLQETFGDFKLRHSQNRYQARIGIIARQPGVGCINFLTTAVRNGSAGKDENLSFLDLGKTPQGGSRKAVLREIYHVINQGDTNFDLFRQHCRAISLEKPIEPNVYYEQKATFTFVVK